MHYYHTDDNDRTKKKGQNGKMLQNKIKIPRLQFIHIIIIMQPFHAKGIEAIHDIG